MISLKKLEKMELLAFKNALRLHEDSISLYKLKRFPSALYLSILSQEEFGKAHIISHFVWHSRINGRMSATEEEEWLGIIYKHPSKQTSFARHYPHIKSWKKNLSFWEFNFNGKLEVIKQNAVYVGLKRSKRKINIKSRIHSPFNINSKIAGKQITIINDYLISYYIGLKTGQCCFENEKVVKLFNKNLFKRITSSWKNHGYTTKQQLTKYNTGIKKFIKKPL